MSSQVFFAGRARVGVPREARVFQMYREEDGFPINEVIQTAAKPVELGRRIFIGDCSTIYEGAIIGDNCVIEDHSRIGFDTTIGNHTRIMYGAFVCDRVRIGQQCRIAGFVCDAAQIGDNCTMMGQMSHKYTVSDLEWGEVDEPSPVLESGCIVGIGAQIVGGIVLGTGTFVASGAVLTKSTPPNSIVVGINQIHRPEEWRGSELRAFFERRANIDHT